MNQKGFFDGVIGKYFLPGMILQGVLIGGGYATGREIMEYGGKFGSLGWWSGLATLLGFIVVSILTFEFIRLYQIYDFKSFLKGLIGPLFHVFDVVYILFMVIIIAVMSSATGAVVEQMTGLNYWYGVIGITIVVAILHFYGENIISYFETIGTVGLYAGYICFAAFVLYHHGGNVETVLAANDHSYTPDATIGLAFWTGIIYMAYNLVVFPSTFFTVRRLTTRRQAVGAGIISGLLMTIPWFLTYFAILCFYPDKSIVEAPVPWVVMMQDSGAPGWMFFVFSFVMGWTLIETAAGIIHAMLDRINKGLEDAGRSEMSRRNKGLLTIFILAVSILFSKIGIISLIAQGYSALAYAFIVLYLLPLCTVGVYKICKKEKELSAAKAAAEK